MTAISGNTYPVKDLIRALGGRWDPAAKAWNVPDDKAEEARALVAKAPAKAASYTFGTFRTRPASSRRPYECPECGDKVYPGSACWETGLQH